ncbi:MAG TPA: NUMOD4 domain-containing protein [Polyangiaceae bacterium]|nr:NUMOD4 domain-containing protein [Polyangiaceae bacterium]
MSEQWRDVPEWEGFYEVSDRGRVRSVRWGRIMRAAPASDTGYPVVKLSARGKRRKIFVHSLVLQAFVGPCPAGCETRHFPDPTRTNVNLSNLSWGTRAENVRDKFVHGYVVKGARNPNAKLNEAQVRRIRSTDFSKYGTTARLARKLGVSWMAVYDIRSGKKWRHVS